MGAVQSGSNQGIINGISFKFFEPNVNCQSQVIHSILQTKYQDQTLLTRKKAAPYLQIVYNYDTIFTREFRQLERFMRDVDESLTPFYAVDLSRGTTPSNVASAASKWTVSIDDTYFYSATPGYKANRAFFWNGIGWKEGAVTGVTLNASITVDIQSNNFGALPLGDAPNGLVYPMYEVYAAAQTLQNFRPGEYWEEDISVNEPGGYTYSGNVNFITRYKL